MSLSSEHITQGLYESAEHNRHGRTTLMSLSSEHITQGLYESAEHNRHGRTTLMSLSSEHMTKLHSALQCIPTDKEITKYTFYVIQIKCQATSWFMQLKDNSYNKLQNICHRNS